MQYKKCAQNTSKPSCAQMEKPCEAKNIVEAIWCVAFLSILLEKKASQHQQRFYKQIFGFLYIYAM